MSQTSLIAIIKGKLMPLDNILPLLLELSETGLINEIHLITSDKNFSGLLQSQPVFLSAIKRFKIKVHAPTPEETQNLRIVRVFKIIQLIFFKALKNKTYFINFYYFPSFFRIFIKTNKILHGGSEWALDLTPIDPVTNNFVLKFLEAEYKRAKPQSQKIKPDLLISSYKNSPTIIAKNSFSCGYSRGFLAWNKFLIEHAQTIDMPNRFMFWPLTVLEREEKNSGHYFDLERSIIQTLKIIKNVRPDLHIVFRYHPTTNIEKMKRIIDSGNNENIVISNAHPIQLIQKCDFVFSNTGTSVFCDAAYLGVPVVQFSPDKTSFIRKDQNNHFEPLYKPLIDHFATDSKHFKFILLKLTTISNTTHKTEKIPKSFRTRQIKEIIPILKTL